MRRRQLIAGLAVLTGAGCSRTGSVAAPSLGDAQNWASSVVAALSELGEGAIADGSLGGQNAVTAQALIGGAQAALAAFIGPQSGSSSGRAVAEELLSGLQALAPLIPLDPGVRAAVQLGISVLDAFVRGVPMTVPGVPVTLQKLARS